MKAQPGTMDELQDSSKLGVVADAVYVYIAREQLSLNSFLPNEQCEMLRAELRGATLNGAQYAVEVIWRYNSLVGLLKAASKHTGELDQSGWVSAQTSIKLAKASELAAGYGWHCDWGKFNVRLQGVS